MQTYCAFWFGEGAAVAPAARQRLLRQLETMPFDEAAGGAVPAGGEGGGRGNALLRRLRAARIGERHYVHGTAATHPLVARVAARLEADAGFATHRLAPELAAGHLGPVTHAAHVLPLLAKRAGLAVRAPYHWDIGW